MYQTVFDAPQIHKRYTISVRYCQRVVKFDEADGPGVLKSRCGHADAGLYSFLKADYFIPDLHSTCTFPAVRVSVYRMSIGQQCSRIGLQGDRKRWACPADVKR